MPRLNKAQLAERREAEWGLYVNGWTMPQIARHYQLDVSTISDDLRVYRDAIPAQTRETMIERHHAKLADVTRRLEEISRLPAPPVTAGKDGAVVVDPETSEIVRDYGGQITALRELRTTLAQEAKLAGLNAADKLEVSGTVEMQGSVDAELQRLADELGMNGVIAEHSGAQDARTQGV